MRRSEWAQNWWDYAMKDLQAAEILLREDCYDACILHCQQSAEKAAKALWIDVMKSEPPKTHWIERLVQQMKAPDDIIDKSAILSNDFVVSRYPDAYSSIGSAGYSEEDANERIVKVKEIINWISEFWKE